MRVAAVAMSALALLSVLPEAQACGREPRESVEVAGTRFAATYDCDNALASCIEACGAGVCAQLDGADVYACGDSNGIWGCQRGDEVVDDTCGGKIESDTILF